MMRRRRQPQPRPQLQVKVLAIPFSTTNWPPIASAFPALFQQAADSIVQRILRTFDFEPVAPDLALKRLPPALRG